MKVESIYLSDPQARPLETPIFTVKVEAGFPSPADDHMEGKLDLNKHLIDHPVATFFVRVSGDSMIGAGIFSGDLLIVDRALEAKDGDVILAVLDGEFTVKRLRLDGDAVILLPENEKYQPIKIHDGAEFEVWGVVTNTIHNLRK
jgi:DNA polymerase V